MIRPTSRQKDTSGWRQSMNPELVVGWLPALPCNNRGAKRHETLSASSASLKRSSKGLACHILPSPCRCLARSKPWVVQVSYICSTWMMDTCLQLTHSQRGVSKQRASRFRFSIITKYWLPRNARNCSKIRKFDNYFDENCMELHAFAKFLMNFQTLRDTSARSEDHRDGGVTKFLNLAFCSRRQYTQ